jgi:hypothetical protein
MVLTDEQVEAMRDERQWARDLADKMIPTVPRSGDAGRAPARHAAKFPEADLPALEESVRRMALASEFKYRKRPTWLYVAGCAVSLVASVEFLLFVFGRRLALSHESPAVWLMLGGMHVVGWFALWHRAMPICPGCHQNIRTCTAEHCHVCGNPLKHRRCADCGVDFSWTGWFRPMSNGTYQWITYCPGCGAELDTRIRRWRANDGI